MTLFPREMDLFPRSPFVPWNNEAENTVHDMSHWVSPELQDMPREPRSSIVRAIERKKIRPGQNTGLIAKHNPFLKVKNTVAKITAGSRLSSTDPICPCLVFFPFLPFCLMFFVKFPKSVWAGLAYEDTNRYGFSLEKEPRRSNLSLGRSREYLTPGEARN